MDLRKTDAGIVISVRLQPGANRIDAVEEMAGGRRLRVRVTAAPE